MKKRSSETSEERVARYIRLAGEARDLASRTRQLDRREECLSVAESWLAMAHGSEGKPTEAETSKAGARKGSDKPSPTPNKDADGEAQTSSP
jgi:hypothetical protein